VCVKRAAWTRTHAMSDVRAVKTPDMVGSPSDMENMN